MTKRFNNFLVHFTAYLQSAVALLGKLPWFHKLENVKVWVRGVAHPGGHGGAVQDGVVVHLQGAVYCKENRGGTRATMVVLGGRGLLGLLINTH